MIRWTGQVFLAPLVFARHGLVVEDVELLFFPAVTVLALGAVGTAFGVVDQEVGLLPQLALHRLNLTLQRVPPQVLPVVCIDTQAPVVVDESKRTKLGLVVVEIEVDIIDHIVEQRDRDLFF